MASFEIFKKGKGGDFTVASKALNSNGLPHRAKFFEQNLEFHDIQFLYNSNLKIKKSI